MTQSFPALRSRITFSLGRTKLFAVLALLALGGSSSRGLYGQQQIVISQVYGAGGNAGALLKNDYVELFNRSATAVSVTNWSVQYASATGTGNFGGNPVTVFSATLQPGQYYLVQMSGGTNGAPLPTPDTTGTVSMAAGAGKVALVNSAAGLACNGGSNPCSPAQLASIKDLVGYGNANFFEGSGAAPTISTTTAAIRANGGCVDTNNNAVDFTAGTPTPRNTSSPSNNCFAPLAITNNSSLTGAFVYQHYSVTFTASGGTGTGYGFSKTSGSFPPGFNFANGTLSGQPTTTSGSPFAFTIQVTDSGGNQASKDFSLVINPVPTCSVTHTIGQIQGSGTRSPVAGQTVTTTGIVTGLRDNGFFIQMPPPGDGDPETSDGIFVYTSSAPSLDAVPGNAMCVTGTVQEYPADPHDLSSTEIAQPTVFAIGIDNPLPPPVIITAADTTPGGGLYQLEKFEGMRIQVDSLTAVAPTRGSINETSASSLSNGFFYGVITGIARPFREIGVEQPDELPAGSPCCVARWDANPEILGVNTGDYPGSTPLDVNAGAVLTNVIGLLDFTDRYYTILTDPFYPPAVSNNYLTAAALLPATSGEFTVASFNLQGFYDTVNDPGTSDVVLTPAAFERRLAKASLAIRNVLRYPDIIGVQEVENLATLQAIATRVNNDAVGSGDANPGYVAYLEEGNDSSGIDVGLLVKPARFTGIEVIQVGKDATYYDPVGKQQAMLNDRPPLVLHATVPSGPSFTLIVNHLRSLIGIDSAADGPRVRAKREAQAEYLAGYIQSLQAANPAANIVSVGDYNAYQFSDGYADVMGVIKGSPAPADQVVLAGPTITVPPLTDLVETLEADQRYSYSESGSAQVLDHILVNSNMLFRLTGMTYARLDADFPETYRNDPNRPERISDHDVPVAYFSVDVTAPVTTAVPSIPANANGWYNSDVVINLTASDNSGGAGVKKIHYTISGAAAGGGTLEGEAVGNSTSLAFTSEGSSTLTYYAIDNAGNKEAAKSLTILIDKTPPVISGLPVQGYELWPPNNKLVKVATVTVSDGLAGPASFNVVGTSSEPSTPGDPDIVITGSGLEPRVVLLRAQRLGSGSDRVYTLTATAQDLAGNTTTVVTKVIAPHDQGK